MPFTNHEGQEELLLAIDRRNILIVRKRAGAELFEVLLRRIIPFTDGSQRRMVARIVPLPIESDTVQDAVRAADTYAKHNLNDGPLSFPPFPRL